MSVLKRLWTMIARFAEAPEGMDGPSGDYMFSLGKRVDKLECKLEHLGKATAFAWRRRRDTAVDKSSNHVSRSLRVLATERTSRTILRLTYNRDLCFWLPYSVED